MALEIGQAAPIFTALTDEGESLELSELKGKNVVLYFYPKDDTPGCTIEAQDFTKRINEFEKLQTVVLGVSKDSLKSHCKFIEKYNIAFNLLLDENGEICEKYGVIAEKSMFGKKYLGINRSTFLIDKVGKIAKIWPMVKVNGHVEEVLQAIKSL
jgi:peroxiredoxin Q/BCP